MSSLNVTKDYKKGFTFLRLPKNMLYEMYSILRVLPTLAHASQISTLVFNVLVVKFLGPRSLIWYDRQPAGCTLKQCYFWFLNWTFGERCVSRQQQKWLPIKNYKKLTRYCLVNLEIANSTLEQANLDTKQYNLRQYILQIILKIFSHSISQQSVQGKS